MADTKITDLSAIASIVGADVIAVVDDVSGTPITKKATVTQVLTYIDANITALQNLVEDTTPQLGGNLDANSKTIDGRVVATDGTKLDTIETSATADQTNAEIKTAYEANADTNAYTDSEVTVVGNTSNTNTGDEVVSSTTVAGVSELATLAELDTGTDTTRAVTVVAIEGSARSIKLDAISGTNTGDEAASSVTVSGIVELATIAETDTGTDATRAVTPDGLQGSALQTKVDGIEAAADVTDETNVAATASVIANTAKVTNATHTGDVSGATALTIGSKKVTLAMMEDGTDGELITYSATGVAAKVAVGTSGHVLTSGGTGVAPTFQAAVGGGDALVANPLSQFAATTSLQLKGVISDETGSSLLVFNTSPTLVTPVLGTVTSGVISACTSTSMVMVTPVLGTPTSGALTNCTAIPMAQASGILPDANMPNLTGDVTTTEGAVATSITDNAVTLAHMAGGTDGELITWDASGDPAVVAVGTATHVLTSNGVGVAPTFQAAAGGAAKQTQFSEDSARVTIATVTSVEIQPAAGEFDQVTWRQETNNALGMYLTDGTNDTQIETLNHEPSFNSTNTIYVGLKNLNGSSQEFQRAIITMTEEA